jgi:hypothetical protein
VAAKRSAKRSRRTSRVGAATKGATGGFAFQAKVVKLGMMYVVDVPHAVSESVGVRGYVPIAGVVKGTPLRASFIPRGDGCHRVLLNGEIRRAAGIALGERVTFEIRVDREPRGTHTPEDVADALRDEGVLDAWESLAPGKRMHIIHWVEKAVHEETRIKRIARVIEIALGEREKRLDREIARMARRERAF